jgi:BirA family biotin operon repressor/biotin-[acetyl-CoA-carboxylase] ligase
VKYDGLTPEEVAQRLDTRSCLVLERVSSTQDLLHELAGEGAPAGTVVLANEQVHGRGRQTRPWVSGPGKGVLVSYLFRPEESRTLAVMSLRVGLAVLGAFDEIGVDAMLKWPNDVMIAGRKVAGILCEARWQTRELQWVVAGIGINVFSPIPGSLRNEAIALDQVTRNIERLDVLRHLIRRLHHLPDSEALTQEESHTLRTHDWLVNREIARPVEGTARGVARNGALMVETSSGTVNVFGGEVVVA